MALASVRSASRLETSDVATWSSSSNSVSRGKALDASARCSRRQRAAVGFQDLRVAGSLRGDELSEREVPAGNLAGPAAGSSVS